MRLSNITPILRIFDEAKAREFYIDFLGFSVDFEHRFADDLPLYLGLSLSEVNVHLSEHHGDSCPGAAIRVEIDDLDKLQQALNEKRYRYARPGIQSTPWGTREMSIHDPFGNRLTFVGSSTAQ
ncbi:MAG: glyoxalase superfamily protein [Pseudomonadota bacterium]